MIDQYPRTVLGGYASEGYQVGLLAIISAEVLAFIWFMVPDRGK